MGHHCYVQCLRKPDSKWRQMKAAYDACQAAGVGAPQEVREFFDDCVPDPRGGVMLDCPSKKWSEDSLSGIEVAIKDIPEHVTHIVFTNSW